MGFRTPRLNALLSEQPTVASGDPVSRQLRLQARLQARLAPLHERLSRLYGSQPGFDAWFDTLIQNTLAAAMRRPAALWRLDLEREQDPDWFRRGGVGYCAYADKFGGTLGGIRQRIPHLKSLGVSYLHLLPFLQAGTPPNDGGFAVASFEAVEPALGTWEDLGELTTALREAGISLCSDAVLNHVSHDHPWARGALAGDERLARFFHWLPSEQDVARWERQLPQVFPDTAPGNFTHIAARNAWVRTTFYPYQWDLNWSNPEVFAAINEALLKLANQGIEAFRLDSTGYLWKREGTDCLNQPEVHDILQALRALMDIAAPGVLMKAEAIMPTRDLPPYFGLGAQPAPECHLAYHSSLMAAAWVGLATHSARLPAAVLAGTPPLPDGAGWLSYVRCHDDIGWNVLRPEAQACGLEPDALLLQASEFFAGRLDGSYARGASFQTSPNRPVHGTNGMLASMAGLHRDADAWEARKATDRILLLQSLSYFTGDLPLLYMGDEFGQDNVPQEEVARRIAAGNDGRELHRPAFDEAGLRAAQDPTTPGGRVLAMLRHMAAVRRTQAALSARPLRQVDSGDDAVLALQRSDIVLGLFNFSAQGRTVDLGTLCGPARRRIDLLSGQPVPGLSLVLPPHGSAWVLNEE